MAENPTPTPGEATRGVGTGEQLPYGAATEANADLAAGDAVEEQLARNQVVKAVPYQGIKEIDTGEGYDEYGYRPNGEMEEVLFGPSEGLGRDTMREGNRPLPNSVVRALPMLSSIVNDPTTPPAIKAAYAAAIRMLEAEQEAKYK